MGQCKVLLTWAAVHDLAKLCSFLHHNLYAVSSPTKVLCILVALYGLRQSAYEFYMLIMSLLLDLGLIQCDIDHGIFIGEWFSPPDPSITVPIYGPLILQSTLVYIPLHIDDGLAITNSIPLYTWFLKTLLKCLQIVDLGSCSKILSILIIHNRVHCKIWLLSHIYVSDLLDEWNLASCKTAPTPFPSVLSSLLTACFLICQTPILFLAIRGWSVVYCTLLLPLALIFLTMQCG